MLTLLEHDYRFSVFSEFLFYDFMQPVKLPGKQAISCPDLTRTLPFRFLRAPKTEERRGGERKGK